MRHVQTYRDQTEEWGWAQTDFQLSELELGLLPSLFMVGLMLTSLLLCELRNHVNPFRLIGSYCRLPPPACALECGVREGEGSSYTRGLG